MAYIQKVKRKQDINYRVFIKTGSKRITKTFNSKRAAVQFANAIESDRNKLLAYTQSKSRTLLSIVIDKYLSSEYKGTRVNDERRKLSFWLEALGDKPIIYITTIDINQAISTLPSHFKNATINRYISAISVVFSYACRQYGLHTNPGMWFIDDWRKAILGDIPFMANELIQKGVELSDADEELLKEKYPWRILESLICSNYKEWCDYFIKLAPSKATISVEDLK